MHEIYIYIYIKRERERERERERVKYYYICIFSVHLALLIFTNLFLLLFMSHTALFCTIFRSHYIISTNFYFYLQYFQQKIFSFSEINESQTDKPYFYAIWEIPPRHMWSKEKSKKIKERWKDPGVKCRKQKKNE